MQLYIHNLPSFYFGKYLSNVKVTLKLTIKLIRFFRFAVFFSFLLFLPFLYLAFQFFTNGRAKATYIVNVHDCFLILRCGVISAFSFVQNKQFQKVFHSLT